LEHSSLQSQVTKRTLIYAHSSALTEQLSLHCQGQTIFVTLVTNK